MAYTDAQLRFSNEQDLATPAAGTITGTNVLDLLAAVNNLAMVDRLELVVTVDATFAGGTSINVLFVQSDNADLSSSDTLAQSGVIATAAIPAVGGEPLWQTPLPNNTKRYVGVKYVTVGDFTTGLISAHLVEAFGRNPYLPANTGL